MSVLRVAAIVTKSYDASYATWVYGKSSTGITGWVRADFLEWL
ncbi:hypothetical protein [uncultured Robinsoniella sp.]